MATTPLSLLQRLQKPGDPRAWDRLTEIYSPLLFFWARRNGLPEADCADLVQDVFAILVRKLPEFQYDPQRGFRRWLRTITVNKCRDYHRKRAGELARNNHPEALGQIESPIEDDTWEKEYRQFVLRRALEIMRADFQPSTWQACWMSTVEGRSAADVGLALNLSPGAVRAAKFRVLAHLRQEMDGLFE